MTLCSTSLTASSHSQSQLSVVYKLEDLRSLFVLPSGHFLGVRNGASVIKLSYRDGKEEVLWTQPYVPQHVYCLL